MVFCLCPNSIPLFLFASLFVIAVALCGYMVCNAHWFSLNIIFRPMDTFQKGIQTIPNFIRINKIWPTKNRSTIALYHLYSTGVMRKERFMNNTSINPSGWIYALHCSILINTDNNRISRIINRSAHVISLRQFLLNAVFFFSLPA